MVEIKTIKGGQKGCLLICKRLLTFNLILTVFRTLRTFYLFHFSKATPPPPLTARPSTSLLLPRPAVPASTPSFTETLAANLSALAEMVIASHNQYKLLKVNSCFSGSNLVSFQAGILQYLFTIVVVIQIYSRLLRLNTVWGLYTRSHVG